MYVYTMGTKTISLADDAYERLKAEKREGESFSDVVRRLTNSATLEEYYGVLDPETADELETAVRERIPILSILLNNFSMAIELHIMQQSTEKYRSTDISGDYAAMARAFGGYGERVTDPAEIIPAIHRGIEQTKNGVPALLEFITSKEVSISSF